jgi:peptidoglycan/xylan/chitin deacetylase (PgdA/CDA1 family)
MRRQRGRYLLSANHFSWPIDPKAASMPKDWKGWPNGKKFALVLTHDVESPKGVRQVKPLIELEKQLGFRSSFNFVGRDYHVPEDLLETLRREGFEVGVHGLHHDGMMFATKASFRKHAKGINIFLKQWDAVGFRSPSMHQKLEWIHELDIRYDSSTFDTDPFEPQPEGVRAIFPFWVVNEEKTHAFVELPYTLAQDFTLFILLRFMDIDIWKRKLDWIAENGGMALLNTHPDYMCWDGAKPSGEEYPVQHYRDLLEYIRNNYQGYYHHALPHEIASHFSSTTPSELSSARLLPQI